MAMGRFPIISSQPEKSSVSNHVQHICSFRSKLQQSAIMESLPDEIWLRIFSILSAKQLTQMKTLSKQWNTLLSQPSFAKSHVHHSIHNNSDHILFVFHSTYSSYCESLTANSSPSSPNLEITDSIRLVPAIEFPTRVIGSINGLICLSKMFHSSPIHIWNPSLSAILTLPSSNSLEPKSDYATSIRFGFDPKSDDYKLVKLTGLGFTRTEYTDVKEWLQVEMYSMRKRSWKLINQPFPSHITRISNTDFLCVDGYHGYLHWQNETVPKEATIVSFDLNSERFHEIPLPECILDSDHSMHRLGVLGGKLCEMAWHNDGAWEIWVMEKYGVLESWMIRHVLYEFTGDAVLYGVTLRNELVVGDEYSRLVLYDLFTNKAKLSCTKHIANKIVEYIDSLVWV